MKKTVQDLPRALDIDFCRSVTYMSDFSEDTRFESTDEYFKAHVPEAKDLPILEADEDNFCGSRGDEPKRHAAPRLSATYLLERNARLGVRPTSGTDSSAWMLTRKSRWPPRRLLVPSISRRTSLIRQQKCRGALDSSVVL
ncbi:hypothetical protein G3M48_000648 [Beauveria asiatica]|uniref:Uncharacterized protein n=1 Tax=Beauveria asiatica TaxID=1069075 RepID=A0AAW0S1E4_9HYPO